MRVELPPSLAAVARGSGVAGILAALAGVAAAFAVVRPWYEARAELTMLGVAEDRAVTVLVGWVTPAGVLAALAGLVAAALGAALALDRHPGWTRPGLLTCAGVLGATGLFAHLRRPGLDRFPDHAGALRDLRAVVGELPRGVELTLTVQAGIGATIAPLAGVAVLVAVAAARDLDQR